MRHLSETLLVIMAVVFVAAIVLGYPRKIREAYRARSAGHRYLPRCIGRSFVGAMIYGVGAIGTEGFGLPAPVTLGLVFSAAHDLGNESRSGLFLLNLQGFAVSWIAAFLYYLVRERLKPIRITGSNRTRAMFHFAGSIVFFGLGVQILIRPVLWILADEQAPFPGRLYETVLASVLFILLGIVAVWSGRKHYYKSGPGN